IGIVTSAYTRYRGGRQAVHTKARNIEFVMLVDTGKKSTHRDIENVKQVILANCFENIAEMTFPVTELSTSILTMTRDNAIFARIVEPDIELEIDKNLRIKNFPFRRIKGLPYKRQIEIFNTVKGFIDIPNDREIEVLLDIFSCSIEAVNRDHILKRIPVLYKKINCKKTPETFIYITEKLVDFLSSLEGSDHCVNQRHAEHIANMISRCCMYYIKNHTRKDYSTHYKLRYFVSVIPDIKLNHKIA
ncbi:hypothetical protein ACFL6D_03455, partial [Spirochaetota bacterium]